MHYIVFQIPGREAKNAPYVMIGAFLEEQEKPNAMQIVEEVGLELYQVKILKDYYYGTPITNHLEKVIHAMVQMMFSEYYWKIEKTNIFLHETQKNLQIRIQSVSKKSLKLLEERYQCENEMLEAVAQGNVAKMEEAKNIESRHVTAIICERRKII